VDQAGEDVAPELVGAEEVLAARAGALLDEALLGRILWREPGGAEGRQHEHADDRQAHQRQAVAAEAAPGVEREGLAPGGERVGGEHARHGRHPWREMRGSSAP
jgi:hypothetical protein